MVLPAIVQGGMGIAVSGWQLAAAVSREGQFGVVSGMGLATAMAHRLQRGDHDGLIRQALAAFPSQRIADEVLKRWYVPSGRAGDAGLLDPPMPSWPIKRELVELAIAGVFVEIYLARQHGGPGPIGINLLTKVEIITLPSLYGAMLAGVDAVFMGAGIPRSIPGILDAFSRGDCATLPLSVTGADAEMMQLDPSEVLDRPAPQLPRPLFFPIVSSNVLATVLLRKSNGAINGFVIEDHTAGGHNAPPRGHGKNPGDELLWDDRDRPSLAAFEKMGLPFYLAGGQDDAAALQSAQAQGATGIQIGTAFAFCEESGLRADIKRILLKSAARGEVEVTSHPLASPTRFPFKVVRMDNTLSEAEVYEDRPRSCDAGYLRTAYRQEDGSIGWRCPAEREYAYVSKGGLKEDLIGRRCLCSGLMAAAGFGDPDAPAIVTAGDSLRNVHQFLPAGRSSYSARDVIRRVMGNAEPEEASALVGRHG